MTPDTSETSDSRRVISTLMIVGLLVSIAATDVVVNRLVRGPWGSGLKFIVFVAFLVWARRFAQLTWQELGLGRAEMREGLRVGLVAALSIAAAISVLVAVPGSRGYFDSSHIVLGSTAHRLLEPTVIIPLGTVFFEETIFRGVLLAALLRWGSRRSAVAISSVAFGLWHVIPAMDSASRDSAIGATGAVIGTIAVTTVAGALFAWLRLRSGSLLAPILAHTATNSFAYVGVIVVR